MHRVHNEKTEDDGCRNGVCTYPRRDRCRLRCPGDRTGEGLCYGYSDPGPVEEREAYGFTCWGPAFHRTYPWDRFLRHVAAFGDAEGFAYVQRDSGPESVERILGMIAGTVIAWQLQHPAVKFDMKQEFYGPAAFMRFIEDLHAPETRAKIDEAHITCHAIRFQSGGRYWLGRYLKELSQRFTGDMRQKVFSIGELYLKVHGELKRFMDFDIAGKRKEAEVQGAVDRLEEACQADRRIRDEFISLRESL